MNNKVEQCWKEFWEPIVGYDLEEIKKELYDYRNLLNSVPKVYDHITGGVASKPNINAEVIINLSDDYTNRLIEEALDDFTKTST